MNFLEYGFLYGHEEQKQKEFDKAIAYFKINPQENKIRREDWLVLEDDPPQHSYIKFDDNLIIALATGDSRSLGQGRSGESKFAIDQNNNLYACKIEETNYERQVREHQINLDLGLTEHLKLFRIGGKRNKEKYYSLQVYKGRSLDNVIIHDELSYTDKVTIARKLAWEIYRLHTGDMSKSHTSYFHGDLKPSNITVAQNGHVSLIDFGQSNKIVSDEEFKFSGDRTYFPKPTEDFNENRIAKMLGPKGIDTFALKRTFYRLDRNSLFSEQDINQMPTEVRKFIVVFNQTAKEIRNIKQKNSEGTDYDYILNMTFALLNLEIKQLGAGLQFNEKLTDEEKAMICSAFFKIESLEENRLLSIEDAQARKIAIVNASEVQLKEIVAEINVMASSALKTERSSQRISDYKTALANITSSGSSCAEDLNDDNSNEIDLS